MESSSKMPHGESEWRDKLGPERYYVCRMKGTEAPFSGKLWDEHRKGTYHCVGCGTPLFRSETKYDSGSGWPSFMDLIDQKRVERRTDSSHGMIRTELLCARCGCHLGHLFEDGPQPTGLRYCINSVSLKFIAATS
ncbi:peptide-methionine (R)-S-oxide reductase MsrB [Sediminispirochaeta smaragdinae]|uniref:Peptide methionine sulfoxide reductase MsrB n=1 Tax=Sediminispirochaeta smaragdinae (strain DSM 11293 / JCM 15392 / SEBR 4228) TaxID=573413 RepID=E1R6P5_SEDSS|nr:peptide-methionine (R)-S-oxide reductase MsrB [Sediminispirochaeta smaragdinae]ADK79177.1 methionine-R-sulfoxide reductase [Sediminispirochaeta smaragdinae DSM 11293]